MTAVYKMNTDRMRQLLSFEPGYGKDASSVNENELIRDFTAMFLARFGMELESETLDRPAEPKPAGPKSVSLLDSLMTKSDAGQQPPVQEAVTAPVQQPAPEPEPVSEPEPEPEPDNGQEKAEKLATLKAKLALMEDDSGLKVDIGMIDMKLHVKSPCGNLEVQLVSKEYDLYYDTKKASRRARISILDADHSTADALAAVITEVASRLGDSPEKKTLTDFVEEACQYERKG